MVLGDLTRSPDLVERLALRIEVEPFAANQAHVYIVARMRSDRPDEIALSVHHHADSAPIEELTLTATMGNYERLRLLWLVHRLVDSRKLYADDRGTGFVEREDYPLDQILRVDDGDALVLCSSDELDPASVPVGHPWWQYESVKLTQHWRVTARHIQPDLRVRVNGRRVYWGSELAIPGGVSYENFEVRQRYVPGQTFVFGLSRQEPWEFVPETVAWPLRDAVKG